MTDEFKDRTINDERLMAYVDGELPPGERRAVEAALAHDADLRARLVAFEETGRRLGSVFDHALSEPVPPALLDLVRTAPMRASRAASSSRMLSNIKKLVASLTAPTPMWAKAMTAAALLAVGLMLGLLIRGFSTNSGPSLHAFLEADGNHIWARGPLAATLEDVRSNEMKQWTTASGNTATAMPILTFKDRTGHYCREYSVDVASDDSAALGLACRNRAGQWSIVIHTAEDLTRDGDAVYRPASGSANERVNALLTHMRSGEDLGSSEEDALIRRGWQ